MNARQQPGTMTPLDIAICEDDAEFARLLFAHGARFDIEQRLVIGAIVGTKQNSLELVKLLVEHGADIHTVYMNELTRPPTPMNALSTAMAWGKQDVVDYLLSLGAKLPEGVPQEPAQEPWYKRIFRPLKSRAAETGDPSGEVIAHFDRHFGPVQPQALVEIVPTEPPIAVHVVPAGGDRRHQTLFTTGLSAQPMRVPRGSEAFRYAELFIQLPGDWPLTLDDARYVWPILWLRNMGKYPHQNQTWLGGPATIVANGDPPEPLAPSIPFTSMLLLNDGRLETQSGPLVQLYRLMPLYTEERALEMQHGMGALLNAFDQCGTPFVVDLTRRNVAASAR